MNKLLFVALEFAPINTTGNFRSLKFVKYLRDFGVEPIVLTLDVESGRKTFDNKHDDKLLCDIPPNTLIKRVSRPFSNSWMRSYWLANYLRIYFKVSDKIVQDAKKSLTSEIDKIIYKEKPKAIYITLPPFSGYSLVNYVKKTHKLPIIVDMRDAWSHWVSSPWQTRLHFQVAFYRERKLFKQSDVVITVTKELGDIFKKSHSKFLKGKIHIIPNGYDGDLNFNKQIQTSAISDTDKIRIGYIGSFYYDPTSYTENNKKWWKRSNVKKLYYSKVKEDWSYRSPLYFLKALSQLFKDNPEYKSRIVFEHIGITPNWLYEMLEDLDLKHNFKSHGFVSYNKVLDIQRGFDYLLATSEKVIGGDHYCLPSKLFDYLKANKPILGFVTEGSQKEFLEKSGISMMFDPDNLSESVSKLKRLFEGEVLLSLNKNYLSSYNRVKLAQRLSDIIHDLI